MAQAYVQVTTTTDERAEAGELATAAVAERFAACAQVVGPISSTYWWEGEIETAQEYMVVFKTTADRFEQLAGLIAERHSYETPEIIATAIAAGSADYLTWVADQTADDEDDDEDVLEAVDDDLEIVE
ncbi:divalent-cation tolerance protein CutA [Actinocorallia sp. A-T 12471]|uniref:divalent-cation tolerance protein CutA n=1 Tax=Actinocorallia sp. A-T 12471 TaxID=3089813 RepID=UPI0029CE7BC2|nr:divalent-cation tolerance protein CutA [Actinocorallia sp. A-T 12471]MDX6744741.1 divalent-cation tolerance protein CutA [Actinocorallia sp. A-T 12471]